MLRNIIKRTAAKAALNSRRTHIHSSLFARTYATDAPIATPRSELKEGIQLIITQRSSVASVSARSIDEIHKAMADIASVSRINSENLSILFTITSTLFVMWQIVCSSLKIVENRTKLVCVVDPVNSLIAISAIGPMKRSKYP